MEIYRNMYMEIAVNTAIGPIAKTEAAPDVVVDVELAELDELDELAELADDGFDVPVPVEVEEEEELEVALEVESLVLLLVPFAGKFSMVMFPGVVELDIRILVQLPVWSP